MAHECPVMAEETFEATSVFAVITEAVAEVVHAAAGAMKVETEIVIWIGISEVRGMTVVRHSEMKEAMIEIGGIVMIILEDAEHHRLRVEAGHQIIDRA